jgi:hypothetical protein
LATSHLASPTPAVRMEGERETLVLVGGSTGEMVGGEENSHRCLAKPSQQGMAAPCVSHKPGLAVVNGLLGPGFGL